MMQSHFTVTIQHPLLYSCALANSMYDTNIILYKGQLSGLIIILPRIDIRIKPFQFCIGNALLKSIDRIILILYFYYLIQLFI